MAIKRGTAILVLLSAAVATSCGQKQSSEPVIRIGHFPNLTHAQALAGRSNGWYQKAFAPEARVEWKSFNAGPSLIEALFAGEIDLAFVGPNPTITGYVRSNGEALRVIAGAVSGGASLVVAEDSGITRPGDFHGRKIASPQLGNTQDVALRAWLAGHGLKRRDQGGDVTVVPVSNADQLTLFLQKQIDAAWAPEPWASRLLQDAHARRFLDERELWPQGRFVTTNVIASTKFLRAHPDQVKRFLEAHVALTEWINQHTDEVIRLLNAEFKAETGKSLSSTVVNDAFGRFEVTYDPERASLQMMAQRAFELGLLGVKQPPDLLHLYDLSILNEVLKEKGLEPVD